MVEWNGHSSIFIPSGCLPGIDEVNAKIRHVFRAAHWGPKQLGFPNLHFSLSCLILPSSLLDHFPVHIYPFNEVSHQSSFSKLTKFGHGSEMIIPFLYWEGGNFIASGMLCHLE